MSRLVRTELLKAGTTRAPWLLGLATLAATAALSLQPVLRAGRDGAPSIGTAGAALAVLDAMGRCASVALVLGTLLVTTEFRHRTITGSLLQSSHRTAVAAAKAAAAALVGLLVGLLCLAVVLVVGTAGQALQRGLVTADVALRAAGTVLTYPLYALLGAALGTLLPRHQPLVVTVPVAWLLGLEALALSFLPAAAPWSLGGVTAATQNSGTTAGVLPLGLGVAALLAYGLLLLGLGAARLARSDIV